MVPWPPTESSGLFPSYLFNMWSQANSLRPYRLHREANSWAPLPIQTCVAKVPTSVSPRSLEWTPWDLQVSSYHSLESIYSLGIPQLLCQNSRLSEIIPSSWRGLRANCACKVKFISIFSIKTFNTEKKREKAQRVLVYIALLEDRVQFPAPV